MKRRHWVSALIGLLLGLSVPFQELLFNALQHYFQLPVFNPYPGWTYFLFFVLSTPAAVAIARYYDLFPILDYDALLVTGIVTHFAFLLPPILFSSFIFVEARDQSVGSFGTIIGIGLLACFVAAALQAVLIEKFFTKKRTP